MSKINYFNFFIMCSDGMTANVKKIHLVDISYIVIGLVDPISYMCSWR
jgi:hypothetical protein